MGYENVVSDYDHRMVEAFVGKEEKTQWYENAFSRFSVNGVDNMRWHWSWWAFIGGFLFLLYRKQYLASLALFVISLISGVIPFGGLIVAILAGGFSPYVIYKGYRQKRSEIEAQSSDEEERIATMRSIGGYHGWVAVVGIVLLGMALLGIIAAIAIPALVDVQHGSI